jgi:GGDEF domain-containing protein
MPAGMGLAVGGSALTCWLTLRAWRTGDGLALVMATGCLLTLPALAGLYALAMRIVHWDLGAQALVALCAVLSNSVTAVVLWQRERCEWRTRETGSVPAVDPVTRVHSSAELVRRLVGSQQRRRHTRREGALVAVTVFDAGRIATLVGNAGMNEVWMTLALRIQRQVGVANPVGRYWDRCFVALVESIPARPALRTLGLRVAASVRQPVEVTARDGEAVRVRVDAGVGVVHLPPGHPEVEDVLDVAQRLAEAARALPARAAMLDPATGAVVPVEQAQLDPPAAGLLHAWTRPLRARSP